MVIKILKGNIKGKKIPKEPLEERPKLSLPREKSKPSDFFQDYSILIYGIKKIGKSSLTAQFPDCLGLFCEPGGRALSMYQVPCRNWRELREYTKLAIKDNRFKTISCDTVDYAYEFCMEYVCTKLVIDHPSDAPYGKAWKTLRNEFNEWATELLHSGKGVLFISHSKDEEFKTRKGEAFNKVGASMSGQAADIIEGLVDVWGNYMYDGKKRYLVIKGSDEVDAGSRIQGHFLDLDGNPLSRIPMGNSAVEGYRNLIAGFNNKLEGELEKAVAPRKKLVISKRQ